MNFADNKLTRAILGIIIAAFLMVALIIPTLEHALESFLYNASHMQFQINK